MNLQNLRSNMSAKKFIPLRQSQDSQAPTQVSASESLDEIFAKLKRNPKHYEEIGDDLDDYAAGPSKYGPSR